MGRVGIWAIVCMVLLLVAVSCAKATPTPTATPSLRPPILTEAQAMEVVTGSAEFPRPELSGGKNIRNPEARLMTLEEYENRYTQGRSYRDRELPVWVVTMEGEWEHAGIVPPEFRKKYSHGVVVLDAHTGRGFRSSFRFDPIPLEEAQGLDANSYATYPLEVSLSYTKEFVDFPVSEPGYLPDGFSMLRVTLELEHPLQDTLPYSSWFPNQTVNQHYADFEGHVVQVAQSSGGLPEPIEGADQTTVHGFKGWESHLSGGPTWLAWMAVCPGAGGDVVYILYSADGSISLDILREMAESLAMCEPQQPTSTPIGVPTAVPTATLIPTVSSP